MTKEEAIQWLKEFTWHEGEDVPIYDTDVEAINMGIKALETRANYENRLKADMVVILIELKNELIDKSWNIDMYDDNLDFECCYLNDINKLIQQKIDKCKAEREINNNGNDK